MNVAFSGGGSNGLGYFKVWKEIENKKIKFNIFSGCSAGAVMGIPIMSGMTCKEGKNLLKKISGDKYMVYQKKIKKSFVLFRPFMYLYLIVRLRKTFWNSCKMLLKKHFLTWDSVNVLCKKSYIGFCDREKVQRFAGRAFIKAVKKNGLIKTLREKKSITNPAEFFKKIGIFYASNDGIYTYFKGQMIRISDYIIPPWKVILSTFANPAFPDVKIKIGNKNITAWDGGQIDNFASLPHIGKNYISISCIRKPEMFKNGIMQTSNFVYCLFPPKKHYESLPKKKRSFFDFSDQSIEEEYKQKKTNFFK